MQLNELIAKIDISQYGEDSRNQINLWRDTAIKLIAQKDFISHPITQSLVEITAKRINEIKERLCNDENLEENERMALFVEKKVHQIYLLAYTQDPTEEMENLTKIVKDEINYQYET